MYVKTYLNINGLIENCWNEADEFVKKLDDLGKGEELMEFLNEAFDREIPSMEELNDFLEEEEDYIAGVLGVDQADL